MKKDRGPKATEIKAPQRTPGYFYTLFFAVFLSALLILALIAYHLTGPPLQDISGKLALVLLVTALVIGTHHIWKYRIKKEL